EQRLGPGYARMMASLAGEKLGLGRKDEEDMTAALDRVGQAHGGEDSYSQLAATAGAAKNPQQMLDAARKLYAWKKEIARAAGGGQTDCRRHSRRNRKSRRRAERQRQSDADRTARRGACAARRRA